MGACVHVVWLETPQYNGSFVCVVVVCFCWQIVLFKSFLQVFEAWVQMAISQDCLFCSGSQGRCWGYPRLTHTHRALCDPPFAPNAHQARAFVPAVVRVSIVRLECVSSLRACLQSCFPLLVTDSAPYSEPHTSLDEWICSFFHEAHGYLASPALCTRVPLEDAGIVCFEEFNSSHHWYTL